LIFEGGSPFDHLGIIAREMNIPAVYYVKDACKLLKNGDEVELDGLNGQVVLLNRI
jgi:rifampicin phosphotransferase